MRLRTDDGGFTLVELALSAAILSIIITSISGAMIVFLKNGQYAISRDDHSGGAAILASYLDRDLASADRVQTGTANAACSPGQKDLLLSWEEWTAAPSAVTPVPGAGYSAAYDLVDDGAGAYRLERWYCAGSATVAHTVVVSGLAAAGFATRTAGTCGPGSTSVVLALDAYGEDSLSDYSYSGCLQGRLP